MGSEMCIRDSIKMDDARMGLYLDVCFEGKNEWIRVDVDRARQDNERRLAKKSKKSNKMLSTASTDEEDGNT